MMRDASAFSPRPETLRWESNLYSQEGDAARVSAGTQQELSRMEIGTEGAGVILGDSREETPLPYVQERAVEERFRLRNRHGPRTHTRAHSLTLTSISGQQQSAESHSPHQRVVTPWWVTRGFTHLGAKRSHLFVTVPLPLAALACPKARCPWEEHWRSQGQGLVVPLCHCVTLSKSLTLSGPWFSSLVKGNNNSYLLRLFSG